MLPPTMSSSEAITVWGTIGCHGASTAAGNGSTVQSNQSMEVANAIWKYLGPIIFFVGVIGNILILMVMSTRRMRGTSTSDYLIIMAVADLLTIITGMIPDWLEAMGIFTLQGWSPATCKIYKFLSYTFGDTATWIRVLFTLDRFMAICFPMKKTDCCLPQRAKFYCLVAALAACAKNMHVFWTRGAEYETTYIYEYVNCVPVKTNQTTMTLKNNCGYPKPEYKYFETYVRPWIVFTLVNLIPFCVILICNIFIVRAMIRMKRRRGQLSTMKGSGERHLLQTTAMCLAASFTFLICVTPTMVLLIGKPYWTASGTNVAYDISKSISNQLQYINNSANFFLYCLTGQKFRETLVMIFRCRCSDAQKKTENSHSASQLAAARKPVQPAPVVRKSSANGGGGGGSGTASVDTSLNSSPPDVMSPFYGRNASDLNLENLESVVIESTAEVEETGRDVEDDELKLDENRNGGRILRGRPRTGSESSSGISSSTSKDNQPGVTENHPQYSSPSADIADPLSQSLATTQPLESPEHPTSPDDPVPELSTAPGKTKNSIDPKGPQRSRPEIAVNTDSLDLSKTESNDSRNSESINKSITENRLGPWERSFFEGMPLVEKTGETMFYCKPEAQNEASHDKDSELNLPGTPTDKIVNKFLLEDSELGLNGYTNPGFVEEGETVVELPPVGSSLICSIEV